MGVATNPSIFALVSLLKGFGKLSKGVELHLCISNSF